jgi:hypothetical protein
MKGAFGKKHINKNEDCGMHPEPCKVQGSPALYVVPGRMRIEPTIKSEKCKVQN